VDIADRQERTRERRHESCEHDAKIANPSDGNSRFVDGSWLGASGMDDDADRGVTQHQRSQHDDRDPGIQKPHLLKYGFAEGRNVAQKRWAPFLQAGDLLARARAKNFPVGQRGGAQHQDVDADAGDDLIGPQRIAEKRLQQRHRQHCDDAYQ
jgi:hypothetical protein